MNIRVGYYYKHKTTGNLIRIESKMAQGFRVYDIMENSSWWETCFDCYTEYNP